MSPVTRRRVPPSSPIWVPLLVLALFTSPLVAPSAGSHEQDPIRVDDHLPSPRGLGGLAWTGESAYLFGGIYGDYEARDEIVRYEPAAGTVETLDTRLPTETQDPVAVWTGSSALVFDHDWVLRLDPDEGTLTELDVDGPHEDGGIVAQAAVWNGTHAFLFHDEDIVRFDPEEGTFEKLDVGFTHTFVWTAVWAGDRAYVFSDTRVWEFVPSEPRAEQFHRLTHLATNSNPCWNHGSMWTDEKAYLFCDDRIRRFDPSGPSDAIMHAQVPEYRCCGSTVWTGEAGHMLGNWQPFEEEATDDILRYDPSLDHVNSPPQPEVAPIEDPVECGTPVTFDGTNSSDADGDPLSYTWYAFFQETLDGGQHEPTWTVRADRYGGDGTLIVDDSRQERRTQFSYEVVDTQPPSVEIAKPGPSSVTVEDRQVSAPVETGSVVAGNLTVRADASDACDVDRVRLEASTGQARGDRQAPYTLHVPDPPTGETREVTVSATAIDHEGHEDTATRTFTHVGVPDARGTLDALWGWD